MNFGSYDGSGKLLHQSQGVDGMSWALRSSRSLPYPNAAQRSYQPSPCWRRPPQPSIRVMAAKRKPIICHLMQESAGFAAGRLSAKLAQLFRHEYAFVFAFLGEKDPSVNGLQAAGYPVHLVEQRPGSGWRSSRRLVRVLERERVDLVHVHQATTWLYGAMARLHYRRPPILLTEHERAYPDYPPLKRVAAIRVLLETRDRFVAVSHSVRRSLILNEGVPAERVAVIYHGIAPLPAALDHVRESARREIGVGSDSYLILQVARLDPVQNHTVALRALEQVVRSVPQARLALVGEGPEKGMVREMARRHGLETHVLFLGGRTDYDRLMAAADVVLLTSLSEELPFALVYALAAGRPVVAIRAGSVGEVVEDRRSGLLACPHDDYSLTENLLLLCNQPDLRAQLGHHGQERAERMFSEAAMAQSYLAVYREMLGQGRDENGPGTAIMLRH